MAEQLSKRQAVLQHIHARGDELLDESGQVNRRLARELGVSGPTMSTRVMELVTSGLLVRDKGSNPRNKLTYALRLTEAGLRAIGVASQPAWARSAPAVAVAAPPPEPVPAKPPAEAPPSPAAKPTAVAVQKSNGRIVSLDLPEGVSEADFYRHIFETGAQAICENKELRRRDVERSRKMGALHGEIQTLRRQIEALKSQLTEALAALDGQRISA